MPKRPHAPARKPAYPAARAAAVPIAPHFARQPAAAEVAGPRAPVPDIPILEAFIDAAFWASLRREEGLAPRISLAFVAHEHVPFPLGLERPLPFAPLPLARVPPAVERPGIHLAFWPGEAGLEVWGTAGV